MKTFGAAYSFVSTEPDSRNQPPRFYAAFASGGGVVATADVAKAMKSRGFEAAEIDLLPSEKAWLAQNTSGLTWDRTYLVRCPAGAYPDPAGGRVCGFPDLDQVDESQLVGAKLLTEADYAPIARWADPSQVKRRCYLSKRGPTADEERLAAKAVAAYDQLAANVEAMRPVINIASGRLPWTVLGPYTRGAQVLIEYAQPVAEWRKGHQQGTTNRTGFGVIPQIVLAGIVVAALIVIGTGSAVILANRFKTINNANLDLLAAREQTDRLVMDRLADPTLTPAERVAYLEYLAQRQRNAPKMADPWEAVAKVATAAVPLAIIGVLLWFGGPAIKEAGAALGDRIRASRTGRKALAAVGL